MLNSLGGKCGISQDISLFRFSSCHILDVPSETGLQKPDPSSGPFPGTVHSFVLFVVFK